MKYKTHIYALFAYALAGAALAWGGETYFLGLASGSYTNLNNSAVWSNDFSESSDLVIDASYENFLQANTVKTLTVGGSVNGTTTTVNSITANGNALKTGGDSGIMIGTYQSAGLYSATLKVNDDIDIQNGIFNFTTRGRTGTVGMTEANLIVGGSLKVGSVTGTSTAASVSIGGTGGYDLTTNVGNFYTTPLASASIGGDVYIGGGSQLKLNVGLSQYGADWNADYADVKIAGVVVGNTGYDSNGVQNTTVSGTSALSAFFLRNITSATATSGGATGVISVGGLSGKLAIRNNAAQYSTGKTLSVLVLNNAAGTTYTSTDLIADDLASLDSGVVTTNGVTGFNADSKVKIVMNGKGTQIFTGRAGFSGGVVMNSGKLLFNSNNDRANGYNNGLTDGKSTLYTHGDLEMNGGTFGFYYATKGGSWSFNNIIWKGGSIQLCVYDSSVDVITLDQIDGKGGALTVASGSISDMFFDFEGAGNSDYLITDSRKIISWSSYDESIKFAADDIYFFGELYEAIFDARADGLYVQYIQVVPEPAAIAGLLGAVALVMALSRRSKGL